MQQNDTKHTDRALLAMLVCPLTKGPLLYDAEKQELISQKAKIAYPIYNGVPILLPSEARSLSYQEEEIPRKSRIIWPNTPLS